jgi:hypothetical protein
MGFRVPHYHCHIYPQYEIDDPFRLLNPQDGDVRLESEEWDGRVERNRAELERFVAAGDPTRTRWVAHAACISALDNCAPLSYPPAQRARYGRADPSWLTRSISGDMRVTAPGNARRTAQASHDAAPGNPGLA